MLASQSQEKSIIPTMALNVPLDQPCGECETCTTRECRLEDHSASFEVISNSYMDGVFEFESFKFTTNQIANAFAYLMHGHIDWQIRQDALER